MRLVDIWRKQKLFFISMLMVALATGVVLGSLATQGVRAASQSKAVAPDATPLVIPPPARLSNQFTELAKRIEPTVVFIQTEVTAKQTSQAQKQTPRRNRPQQEDEGEDPQADLFRRFFGDQFQQQVPQVPRRREGQGSGFVVDRNGYILTNLHVVDGADKITVSFPADDSSPEYKAKLIGFDVESDVAVIKIDAGKQLLPLKVANSDGVQVGDWAVAIGAPFGLEASVTAGIVSATGRDIGAEQFQKFIQTDAAINPGNSGGPLVNINGEVIGINTMIATRTGGYEGIGFALPINMAVKAYNDIIQYGAPRRGSIGVSFPRQTKQEVIKSYGYDGGVVLTEITEGGPAEKAGLKVDDLILALNGKPVKDGDDLVGRIANTAVGTEIALTIDRDGKKMERKVVVGDRLEVFKKDARFSRYRPKVTEPEVETASTAKFGFGVKPLTAEARKGLNLEGANGVVVTIVEDGSFAEDIGIQPNDVILAVNRTPVSSIDDIRHVQTKLKVGDPVSFKVARPIPAQVRRPADPAFQTLFPAGRLPKAD